VTSTAGTFGVAMVPFTRRNYHIRLPIAAGRLRFFSGVLRRPVAAALCRCVLRFRYGLGDGGVAAFFFGRDLLDVTLTSLFPGDFVFFCRLRFARRLQRPCSGGKRDWGCFLRVRRPVATPPVPAMKSFLLSPATLWKRLFSLRSPRRRSHPKIPVGRQTPVIDEKKFVYHDALSSNFR